jgi:endonuclease G
MSRSLPLAWAALFFFSACAGSRTTVDTDTAEPMPAPDTPATLEALESVDQATAIARHLKFETDNPDDLIIHTGYVIKLDTLVISRDTLRLFPRWTIYELTPEQIIGTATRPGSFATDPLFDARLQARHDDYTNRGYDRGHIVPAADFNEDQTLKDETFLVTNIAPQTPRLNQGPWKKLEDRIRGLVEDSSATATVVTGTIYGRLSSGTLVFKFKSERGVTIGVPSYFYKVVYTEVGGRTYLYAFLFPHMFDYDDENLSCYQVTLAEIEAHTGEAFFEQLANKAALTGVVLDASPWLGDPPCPEP